jgi:hypothetical protein
VARPRRATAHPHLRWDDPGPMVARAAILARTAVSRAAHELHARDSG